MAHIMSWLAINDKMDLQFKWLPAPAVQRTSCGLSLIVNAIILCQIPRASAV